jgi:uncharacterized DUF497 family protein
MPHWHFRILYGSNSHTIVLINILKRHIINMKQSSFEWDINKDELNVVKHGVSFYEAQIAFLDPDRIIAQDVNHSHHEKRYYCFGRVSNGVMTVRFTYRGGIIRIIGAGYWREGRKIYEEENCKI